MVQNEKTKKPKQTQKTIIDEEENDIFIILIRNIVVATSPNSPVAYIHLYQTTLRVLRSTYKPKKNK